MTKTEDCSFWIVSNAEMSFFKIFTALLSLILAQSVTLTFWLKELREISSKYGYKRKYAINNIRGFSWYFTSWFFRMATIIGIYFILADKKGYYVFKIYPEYNYLFIFFLIVLFLNSWLDLRLFSLKRKTLKILINAVIILILALGLSRIDIVDYKSLNRAIKKSCIVNNSQINLPEYDKFNKLENKSLIKHIYLFPDTINNDKPNLVIDHELVKFSNVEEKINKIRSRVDKSNRTHLQFIFHIDLEVRMKYINEIKKKLSKYGIFRIAYAVKPKNPEYDIRYYDLYINSIINSAYRQKLIISTEPIQPQPDIIEEVNSFNKIIIKYHKGHYYINNKQILEKDLVKVLKSKAYQTENYIFLIKVEDNMIFSTYFTMWSSILSAVTELRDNLAFKIYQCEFEDLDESKQEKIADSYPIRFFEVTEEFNSLIK